MKAHMGYADEEGQMLPDVACHRIVGALAIDSRSSSLLSCIRPTHYSALHPGLFCITILVINEPNLLGLGTRHILVAA